MVSNEKIISNWNIGKLINIKKAVKGVSNHNWILNTSEGKFVLRKVSKEKKLSELEFELKYLNYLKEKGFEYKIPYPIKTKQGKFFLKINSSHYWMYHYISGTNIKRFDKKELKEVAKMMASYHKIIEKSGLKNGIKKKEVFNRKEIIEEMEDFRKKLKNKSKLNARDKIFFEESSDLISLFKNLEGKEYSKLKRYPLHRDINPENTLWKSGKLIGVIDFENVGSVNDTIMKDIAGMLQYSCRDKKDKHKIDLKLAKFFLNEYKKYHKLSKKEVSFIPDIITAGAIEDFGYAYWMLINDPERAKLYRLKLYSNVAKWFNKNRNKIIRKLS